MSDQAPDEPHLYSEPSLLSPASPKPIHFPAPTNIPVLSRMLDVSYNQTDVHMQDPSMRNTEIRDGAWKDPEEQEHNNELGQVSDVKPTPQQEHAQTAAAEAIDNPPSPAEISSSASNDVAPSASALLDTTSYASTSVPETAVSNADGIPVEIPTEQASSFALPRGVDVQSLLNSLQAAPQSITPGPAQAALSSESATKGDDSVSVVNTTELNVSHDISQAPPSTNAQSATINDIANVVSGFPSSIHHSDLAASLVETPTTNTITHMTRAPSSQRERKLAAGEPVTEDDMPWTADIQQKYDEFMQDERKYVNDGKWDSFPPNSRLFVGNLSSDSVTKRDIFHVFHPYGPLAQISIKQAYGFVQFLHADHCARALDLEQGRLVKDKKIHLEISKPQKPRNQNNNRARSRSPVNRRGHGRDRDRSYRSPSPRYRDRYDDRYRNRSRTPPRHYGRSPSPRRDVDDDLPLPRRQPHEVPDIQVIVKDSLDRDFIAWVEKAFTARGIHIAVLILSPRLDEDAVMKRQVLEGVLAVSRLDRHSQATGKINLRLFNRSRGVHNVSFDDYDNLDPSICAELVLRAKPANTPATQQQYGYASAPTYAQPPPPQYPYAAQQHPQYAPTPAGFAPQYGQYPAPVQMPPAQSPQVNMAPYQGLINRGQPPAFVPQQAPQQFAYSPAPQTGYNPAQQAYTAPQPQQPPYNTYQTTPASLANLMQQGNGNSGAPAASKAGSVDMQDILARLGGYGK